MITTAAPVCPAGSAVAYFRLEARRPDQAYPIPIDRVNRLQKGDSVVFFPSDPPVPMDVSGARVALMLLTPSTGELRLLETKKGNARQEWVLPEDAAAIAVAYGPRGLDEDRMKHATTKDPELIAQLAEYSEKTAQTEIVLSALSGRRQNDDRAVEAALQGLAASGGGAKLDRTASLDQQTLSLFRTLNPAIGSYDPLAPEPQARWQQSAILAGSVAGLFFGNTVGLAGGGAALFLNMRSLMFPKTELRSALLREAPEPTLCAAKTTASRTKFAYLWARRLPQGTAPILHLARPAHLAIGLPATVAIDAPDSELAMAGRAFRWKLVSDKGDVVEVPVTVPANEKAVRIGQVPPKAKPGVYRLISDWDWTSVQVGGEVELLPLPDLERLRLATDSADRLTTNSGPVRARLEGAPTYFVNSLQILRTGDALAKPIALPYAPGPDGQWLEFEVNTSSLPAGNYVLTATQQGGSKVELPVPVHQPAPAVANLPLVVHQGTPETVVLDGKGLERIERLTSKYAEIDWNASSRQARVTLNAKAPPEIDVEAHVEGLARPLRLANAIRAMGPKPLITSVTRAPQEAGTVERRDDEIDTRLPAAFSLKVQNLPTGARVTLTCKEHGVTAPKPEVRPIGLDTLYFTLPANSPAGCTLTATVEGSNPASIGKTVRLPVISGFELSNDPGAQPDSFKGLLRGEGLEALERSGWTPEVNRDVTALPAPEGEAQKLDIEMPWPAPAPHAPLRIWLRGETEPRLTTAKY
ncbi:MAG TPA: hypothetical protein VFQ91_05550 [Bryobacteraceae bacterium]|nr:hypothetical protein [Bryobacteraceae bacterium]